MQRVKCKCGGLCRIEEGQAMDPKTKAYHVAVRISCTNCNAELIHFGGKRMIDEAIQLWNERQAQET